MTRSTKHAVRARVGRRTQEEGAARAGALVAERDDCKALLLATLQVGGWSALEQSRRRKGGAHARAPLTDLAPLVRARAQRLEAVDEIVHRADVSSAMMQDKVRASTLLPRGDLRGAAATAPSRGPRPRCPGGVPSCR